MLKKLPRSLVAYVTALGIEYFLSFVSEKSPLYAAHLTTLANKLFVLTAKSEVDVTFSVR